jgi:hypothetical protein
MVLEDELQGEAGVFRDQWGVTLPEDEKAPDDARHVRFSVGVATTGTAPNIAGRLFRHEFAEGIWTNLRDRPVGLPPGMGTAPDPVVWSQEALTWRYQVVGLMKSIIVVLAAWDGSAAVGQKLATEDVYPDRLVEERMAPEWRLADQLVDRLGGFDDRYVTLLVAGGHFPRRHDPAPVVMRRGPIRPGVDDEHVASLGRELMRAVGNPEAEP